VKESDISGVCWCVCERERGMWIVIEIEREIVNERESNSD
jgi:hypothetical protein